MQNDASGASISVSPTPQPSSFEVEVKARSATRHRVSVSEDYLRELGLQAHSPEAVLREAFAFLLEREPNTSILARFDLREIERYFPEFRGEIAQRLGAG
jgi:hypothetical protein